MGIGLSSEISFPGDHAYRSWNISNVASAYMRLIQLGGQITDVGTASELLRLILDMDLVGLDAMWSQKC